MKSLRQISRCVCKQYHKYSGLHETVARCSGSLAVTTSPNLQTGPCTPTWVTNRHIHNSLQSRDLSYTTPLHDITKPQVIGTLRGSGWRTYSPIYDLKVCGKTCPVFPNEEEIDSSIWVTNLSEVKRLVLQWRELVPNITPFYAMKCNSDQIVMRLLLQMGIGFECSNKDEIQKALSIGTPPDKIVYSHPIKVQTDLMYARKKKVNLTCADSEEELYKIRLAFPDAKVLIRLHVFDDPYGMGDKFGVQLNEVRKLLQIGEDLDVSIVGFSFHVGTDCDATVFENALERSRAAFDLAKSFGVKVKYLDVGGGFPGCRNSERQKLLREILHCVYQTHGNLFDSEEGLITIAEPGQYLIESACDLYAEVIGKKIMKPLGPVDEHDTDNISFHYYLNDTLYNTFDCFSNSSINLIRDNLQGTKLYDSVLWGASCDGSDCIVRDCRLPHLQMGDWVCFRGIGAYTIETETAFNGIPCARRVYVADQDDLPQMQEQLGAYVKIVPNKMD